MSWPSPWDNKGEGVDALDVAPPGTDFLWKLLDLPGAPSARFVTQIGCGRVGPRGVPDEVAGKVHSDSGT